MPKNGWLGMPTSMRFSASPTITFFYFAQDFQVAPNFP